MPTLRDLTCTSAWFEDKTADGPAGLFSRRKHGVVVWGAAILPTASGVDDGNALPGATPKLHWCMFYFVEMCVRVDHLPGLPSSVCHAMTWFQGTRV